MGYGAAPLVGFSSANAAAEAAAAATLFPQYNNSVAIDSFPKAAAAAAVDAAGGVKSESGITYLQVPRKRGRDHHSSAVNRFLSANYPSPANNTNYQNKNCGCFYFLGEDVSVQIQQQQFDLDRLISQHMEKVRMEVEERRRRQARRILEAIEAGVMKILRNKEEEIEKMGKLNCELEERVNSLCMENQIWRDVAQTNEATANALRCNLEQVLSSQARNNDDCRPETTAESCCGSNREEEEAEESSPKRWRRAAGEEDYSPDRRCKNCRREESCVLLLPCRHLCLCTACGSSLHTCPICNSINNASVRVIMP